LPESTDKFHFVSIGLVCCVIKYENRKIVKKSRKQVKYGKDVTQKYFSAHFVICVAHSSYYYYAAVKKFKSEKIV
jgi:hypothetical protein